MSNVGQAWSRERRERELYGEDRKAQEVALAPMGDIIDAQLYLALTIPGRNLKRGCLSCRLC